MYSSSFLFNGGEMQDVPLNKSICDLVLQVTKMGKSITDGRLFVKCPGGGGHSVIFW